MMSKSTTSRPTTECNRTSRTSTTLCTCLYLRTQLQHPWHNNTEYKTLQQ